eukprot:329075-Chlamydomonas_euryale.AAC.3
MVATSTPLQHAAFTKGCVWLGAIVIGKWHERALRGGGEATVEWGVCWSSGHFVCLRLFDSLHSVQKWHCKHSV